MQNQPQQIQEEIIPCTLSDHQGLRLVFNNNRNKRKSTYSWKQNNTLLNDHLVREEIKKEIKDFLKFNKDEGTTCSNSQDTTKAMLGGKFISLSASIKKLKRSHTSNLAAHLKALKQTEAKQLRGVDGR